jgi:opacity protein-like surface antigen
MKRLCASGLLLCLSAAPAAAQARKGSWEIAPGVVWFSGADLGSSSATLERPGGGRFELFKTDTRLESAFGAAMTVSFFPASRLAIEAGVSYARPGMSTRVSDDAESAAPVTAVIGLQQYLIEGNLRWYLARARGGWRPFLRAGGGYLRQLDDANAHVETGTTAQAGVGADRAFRDRPAGKFRRVGVRADARVIGRSGGFDTGDQWRIGFAAGAALFIGF